MDTPKSRSPTGYRVKGWHVGAAVTAFFVVIVGVDVSFAVIAYRTHPGQVSVTPYEDGLLHDRQVAQFRAQSRLGWKATAEARPGFLILTYVDKGGHPLEGLMITARLERPATETGRVAPDFRETLPGQYQARVGALHGAWDMTAEAKSGANTTFVAERRLTWP
jgi:nitrogen fixation protein FixH